MFCLVFFLIMATDKIKVGVGQFLGYKVAGRADMGLVVAEDDGFSGGGRWVNGDVNGSDGDERFNGGGVV